MNVLRKAWNRVFGSGEPAPKTEEGIFLKSIPYGQTHLFGLTETDGVVVTRGNGNRYALDLSHIAVLSGIPAEQVCGHALGMDMPPSQDGRVVLEYRHAEQVLARLPNVLPRDDETPAPQRRTAKLALVR